MKRQGSTAVQMETLQPLDGTTTAVQVHVPSVQQVHSCLSHLQHIFMYICVVFIKTCLFLSVNIILLSFFVYKVPQSSISNSSKFEFEITETLGSVDDITVQYL